eukprot:gene29055-38107_t
MKEVSACVLLAKRDNIRAVLVEIPLPVTGGTELDDWPGGIKQKYSTLRPMLVETMKSLGFSDTAIAARKYLGGGGGEEDAVGVWNDDDIFLCCFPTVETIPILKSIIQEETQFNSDSCNNNSTSSIDITIDGAAKNTSILVIVNQQFFLDPLSNQQSKDFLNGIPSGYILESLNMKGPGALPVRGILYRQYPHSFKVARRLDDGGGYIVLKTFAEKPSRSELDELFFEDSRDRDKHLSFFQRLQRQLPSF